MRVVVYSPRYFPRYVGGGERLAELTAAGLLANGVSACIVTMGQEAGEYEYGSATVHVAPRDPCGGPGGLPSLLERLEPDIVHAVGAWDIGQVGSAARRLCRPFGVAGLDYGQTCDNHRLIRGNGQSCRGRTSAADCFQCTLEGQARRRRWLAQVGTVMRPSWSGRVQALGTWARGRAIGGPLAWHDDFTRRDRRRLEATRALDLFVAPTKFAKAQTQPFLMERAICAELMYPVADDLLKPEPKRTSTARLHVGFMGRCLAMKGLHVLLDAIEQLTANVPVSLRIAAATNGDEEQDYCQAVKARAARLPNVEWVEGGVFDVCALRAFHADVDVLAVPSLWPEYVGFVTLESLALGTPVILSDFAPQRELLLDRASGEVVRPGDVDALAAALERRWRQKQEQPGLSTRTPAMTATAYARRLLDLYADVPS